MQMTAAAISTAVLASRQMMRDVTASDEASLRLAKFRSAARDLGSTSCALPA